MPVLTEDGEKTIEEIEVGDYVYATDPETGESDYKEVVETFENETKELVHIIVANEEIVSTPKHPFYVPQKGWTNAVDLRAGDILVRSNGEYVVIEQVQHEILEEPVKSIILRFRISIHIMLVRTRFLCIIVVMMPKSELMPMVV